MALTVIMLLALPVAANSFVMELEPRQMVLRIGERQVLRCAARDCSEHTTITWTSMKDKPLSGIVENPSASESLLIFDPVSTAHENLIVCKVSCGNERRQMRATVTVYSFPREPAILGHDHMLVGEPNTLTCEVPAVYPPEYLEIEWLQGGRVLHIDEGKADISTVTSRYKYMPTSEDNGKAITCKARHHFEGVPEDQKTKETTVYLNVMYAPRDIRISETAVVKLGASFTLTCTAEGNPRPVTTWRKVGPTGQSDPVGEHETLVTDHVTVFHAGTYECVTSNMLGNLTATVNVTVQAPPRNTSITVSPAGELKEGDSMTISCYTDSAPAGLLVLRRVSEGHRTDLQTSSDSTASISLPSVLLSDSGLYECEARNQHGSQAASTRVTVKAPPRNTTVQVFPSSQVQEGQNVTICCRTVSFPPSAVILRKLDNGTELYSPDGTFLLVNLTPQDTGLYQVNATNDLGYETEIFTISVMERRSTLPPSWNDVIIPVMGVAAMVIMVATAGLAIYYLNQSRKRGSYELARSTPRTV